MDNSCIPFSTETTMSPSHADSSRIDNAAEDSQQLFPSAQEIDLQTILSAWNSATDRLQKTHEALSAEIARLTAELEAKNHELARKNRLADLGQMAAHVAHEVRNGLVPMKLYLSLLRRRLISDTSSVETLDKVTSSLATVEATVSDLLHFSTQRDPSIAAFDLKHLIAQVCDSIAPQLDAQGITTTLLLENHGTFHADQEMLRRALLNLLLNSLDVMPEGGTLTIETSTDTSGTTLSVRDSGPGISEDHLQHLFEPFFTTKNTGTGLGLAIVDRVVQAHGGYISVNNASSGGAIFTLHFPRRGEELAA